MCCKKCTRPIFGIWLAIAIQTGLLLCGRCAEQIPVDPPGYEIPTAVTRPMTHIVSGATGSTAGIQIPTIPIKVSAGHEEDR